MNPKPVESQSYPTVGRWAWRSRSGLLTLLAGAAIRRRRDPHALGRIGLSRPLRSRGHPLDGTG